MVNFLVSLPPNWEEFLEKLSDDHDIDVGKVIGGLCDWAFSRPEYKAQFEAWLDNTYPQEVKLKIAQKLKVKQQASAKKLGKIERKKKRMKIETTMKTGKYSSKK